MKKTIVIFISVLFLGACQTKISADDLQMINGYWEIEKVILADGSKKEYTINQTYDYFEVKENKGFRKKVNPQLNGKFLTGDDSEQVEVLQKEEKTFLKYKTQYAEWQEELKSISEEKMVIENEQKIEYHYKKAAPINLLDGEETK